MNTEELKAKFSEKLSPETLKELLAREVSNYLMREASDYYGVFKKSDSVFWYKREGVRFSLGVYKATSVLTEINAKFPVFAHVSREDPTQIAFTPDRMSGEADRQIRSSIGRLLARVYPCISEDTLRDLVETHQAEANPDVVFLEGLDIAKAYMNPDSPSSCMRAEEGHITKGWTIDTVPALAYATKGVRLAVLRKSTGGIAARCLVVEINGEKRYIRNYGSPALLKWLQSEGYTEGGWQGVVFNTVKVGEGRYAFPYLDTHGGMANRECEVALVDGQITCPDKAFKRILQNAGASLMLVGAGGTTNFIAAFNAEEHKVTCGITGEKFLPWIDKPIKVFYDGGIKKTCARLFTPPDDYISTWTGVYARLDDTVSVEGQRWAKDEEALREYDIVRRSSVHYEGEVWNYSRRLTLTADGEYIEHVDAVTYIKETGVCKLFKTAVPKGAVSLAPLKGGKVFAAKGVPFDRTDTGVKVHKDVHDIVTLHDGSIAYSRGTKSLSSLGDCLIYYKGQISLEQRAKMREEFAAKEIRRVHAGKGNSTQEVKSTLSMLFSFNTCYLYNAELHRLASLFGRYIHFDSLKWVDVVSMEELRAAFDFSVAKAGIYPEVHQALVWIDQIIAEANAVEAPHYLSPEPVEAVIPQPTIQILESTEESVP